MRAMRLHRWPAFVSADSPGFPWLGEETAGQRLPILPGRSIAPQRRADSLALPSSHWLHPAISWRK
jgi:hypothetical protein